MDNNVLEIIALCACIAAGLIFCFMGNRWRRVAAAIYGLAVGFVLAYTLIPAYFALSPTLVLVISAAAGVVLALLFSLWIYFGIFMIGFGGGALLCLLAMDLLKLNILDWYVYVPAVLISSAIGALTLNLKRVFLSIFTAFIGAVLIATAANQIAVGAPYSIIEFFTNKSVLHDAFSSSVFLIALAAAFVTGLVVQLAFTSKKKD